MEEKDDASASDASELNQLRRLPGKLTLSSPICHFARSRLAHVGCEFAVRSPLHSRSAARGDGRSVLFGQETAPARSGIERVRKAGKLLYGSDMEGGGPYAYPDPDPKSPRGVTGFEVELMTLLGKELGVEPVYSPGPVGQAAAGSRLGPGRRGDQRLRVDPGDTVAITWRLVRITSISCN